MPTKEPKVTRKKITDYLPDNHNANMGSERGLQMLENSLQEDGAGRSIVADKSGKIPAGNKTLEAAMNAGIEDVIEIETDGTALIVHKRSDWDLDDPAGAARRYAYRDNRVSEVSLNWDADVIASDIEAGLDLSGMWTEDEIDFIQDDAALQNNINKQLSEEASDIGELGDKKKQIKPVLYIDQLNIFEAAILATGKDNRGEAITEVCRAYLDAKR